MIYLDNAATSYPKAPGVSDRVYKFLNEVGANAGRSSYREARESSRIIYRTRMLLAELLQVENSERICFTMNTTQALNIAIKGIIKPGMKVLTSSMEHNSVMRPLRWLEQNQNVEILQFMMNGFIPDWDDLNFKINQKPDLLVFTSASNVNGVIMPFKEIAELARGNGIPVILDAAQGLGTMPIDANDFDIVCFPGHKGLLGPMGTGGLYVAENIELQSLFQGGTGSLSSEETQPQEMPDKLESGTPNLPGIAGLEKSLEFILDTGIDKIFEHKKKLTSHAIARLKEISQITIHSPQEMSINAGIASITSSRYSISEIAYQLDKKEIAVRMGLHCAPGAHKTLGTFDEGGTIRFSPGFSNTLEEIDIMADLMKELHNG